MLVDSLISRGWLKTPRIIKAFQRIKRVDFLPSFAKATAGEPDDLKDLAELDEALSIGYGQTISQPLTVAFMMELLQPEPGQKILDIGSGSGWTTTLLAEIISQDNQAQSAKRKAQNDSAKLKTPDGKVIGVEIVPELAEFGQKNVDKYDFIRQGIADIICADGSKGYPDFAACPELVEGFDRILASASIQQNEIPQAWKTQLKVGGRIVAPVRNSIWLIIKKTEIEFEEKEFPGFTFVPLV